MTFSLKGLKTITNYQYEPACGILSLLDISCLNCLGPFNGHNIMFMGIFQRPQIFEDDISV